MNGRRFVKLILWAGLAILVMVSALLFYMSTLNVVEREYATYEKAVAADAFTNAALPGFLPKSSRNIKSSRDLDANVSLVTFNFGRDFDHFLAEQKTADVSAAATLAKRHGPDFVNPKDLKYFPLLSSEPGLYHGSLLVNPAQGRAVYVEPPLK